MNNKLDVLGKPISIGDYVITTMNPYKGFEMGQIIKFTKVMVHTTVGMEVSSQILKITSDEAKNFKKHLKHG